MNQICQMSSTLRPLAWGLAVVCLSPLAEPARGQAPQPDTTELRSALTAKQPAKLKRPPPELSAPARPVRQAAHKAEVVPSPTRTRIQAPTIITPEVVTPAPGSRHIITPEITVPGESDQDYIILDDAGGYGPGYEMYGGGQGADPYRGRIWGRAEYLLWMVEGFD